VTTAQTPAPIDFPTTYLGMYCHGDRLSEAHAAECMTLPTAYLWAIVPERDGMTFTLCRRDLLTYADLRSSEEWASRSVAERPALRDETLPAYNPAAVRTLLSGNLTEAVCAAFDRYHAFVQAETDAGRRK
jgi:hypothetical protein